MSDTLYRVAVSKDGRTESQDYSEADYNSNVIPYLESNYNPDDYSVARLSSADEDNLDDNAQYLVTATNDGGTQEQIYNGADLKTKLGDIRNMFPGQYKVRSIEGAVRRQAEADNTPAEDDWQGRLKQQTSGMAEMTASQMDRIADMANTPDLAERLARQDAMKDLADSTVANVYKQVETTDEEGNTAEEWQLRTAKELQAFQKARDEERTEKAELRNILAQLKEIDDIDKKDTERWNAIVMDENGDGEVSEEEINRFAWDSSKRHQRKAELSRRLNENKYYREEYDSRMALAEKVKKEAQPVIDAQLRISGPKALGEYNYNEDEDRATIEGRDTDALRAARFFANQTEKTLKAADDDTNGFMSFLQGAGATFSDADFWAFGLSSIVNNLKVKDAFDKIADKVQGAYSDESLKQYAEEGDFDKILSPDEVLMIQSFVNASQAQALRAYNTRGLYDSGKIAAESIGFMAQFLATGGVGKAASSGVTKFANWLTTKAISSAVARGAGKAAQLATKGAIRLGQAIAEPAVAAIPMTLLQTGMYKGYAENLTARNDDGSLKYTYGTAILPAMRDAYKEVWSEQALTPLLGVAGKTINKTLGAAADATKVGKYLKTSVSKVTDALGNREALGILADAGFDGFLTEMGEEYLGALLESTWNKGALKDMLNWQEFGKMAAGFAPMSVLGAGASMANYASRVNKYNKAESYIRNLLQEEVDAGRMQQEDMEAMLNRKTSTLADIGNKVSSIIAPLVETRQFDKETFKALWDFAVATGEKEIAEACINRVQSDRRNAVANIINERTGGKNIVSVVDGERTVSYVDDNGTRRYVLTDRTDSEGKYLSYDENGENPRFIDAESYGGLTTMTEDQFYDSEYDALAKAGEQERMQTETEQNKQSLTDAIRAGESKLSLKDASGVQREYIFSGWKGDNAVVIPVDEQGNPAIDKTTNQPVTETRSMQEVADALGMDVTVLTDAQIEQRKIDDMTAAESVVRMGNTQKGAAVEIDGVRGRLARFFARQNEDGTISYMANLVLRGKTTTIEVDKADIEALIEQRKMMTDPQKQDGKQIRKWERKDKLESDRAYSEAKARFTNPDGSVRQSAFLAEDPENFARYSDENYGKADTDATLKANQTAMAQALLQAQQALDAEADPDAKNTLRLAAEQAQARLNTINDLVARRNHDVSSDGALSEEEARQTFDGMLEMGLQEEEIQALANNNIAEAKQAIEAIPAPQITTDIQSYIKAKEEYNNLVAEQQKKIDYWNSILNAPTREYLDAMEAERNLRRQAYNLLTRIGNAQTTETQEQLMKEYSSLMIDHAIAQSSADPEVAGIAADIQSNLGQTDVPVNVVTIANVLDVVKAKGISRENYNDLLRMLSLQHGKSFLSGINTGTTGFTIGGEVYLIADNCRTIESAKTTYYHERQHLINKTDTGLVNAIIANFGKDRNALLEALGKIHSTLGYESLDARSLADEISAYVMEQVLTGQDYARMLSEAGFDNNFIKLFENEQQRQQQPGFSINRYGNGNALFRTDAEGDGTENVGDVQGAAEQESDGYLPRTDDESRADAVAQGSGGQLEISEDASSPIRFSTSAAIEGAGLKYVQQDENGDFAIVFPDGRKMTGRDAIKGDDLKAIPNTVLGYMMADARAIGTITPEVEDMMWQRYADMLNAYLKSGLKENGGFENLIGKWQWLGETAYKTIASNSDKQYSFSMDITRVCKKNEAVINGIAELQKRQGYGATPAQIMDLYLESDALGYQVPCPVCYVFSRYINNGRYATVMINGQREYGDRLADPTKLTEEERKEKIAMWVEELHKQEALNDQNASAITAAKKDIKYILEQIDDISKTLSMPGKRTKKQIDNLKKKAYALDVQYKAALDVVSQGSLDSWIKQFAIKENKDGEYEDPQTGKRYSLYDDTYQGFPEEVALDLRQTATAMREYPAIQRYRNTRGAGAGKEITFVANNDLGEVAMMLGSLNVPTVTDALRADTTDKIDLKYPPNYYKLAVNAKTEEQRNDYLAKARKRFLSAHLYAQQQSLRGGQRMWSWSDNIERLAPDVFLNMFQLRLAGGALQSYSKQLEGVKLVASLGGYVNGSLMGEGIGYREVSADEIETVDGKMYVKGEDLAVTDKEGNAKSLKAPVYEKDGKYYTLVFSKLIGIDAYGGNGKKGLFQLNQELDKAGNILVGMNDLHIEAAMADDRVFFIIPWHASGADSHILKQMLEYLRVNLDNWKPFDYTGVQEEKKYKADDELNKYLIEFWNNHNYESKFACGIEGGIPSGKDGKLSPQQVHYRKLRDAILRGKAVQDSEGKDKYVPVEQDDKWMTEIRNDIFLKQLYNKVRSSVDSEQMTSTDTGFIYPYEYWDTESNYWTADVNGERYLEYCRRLGFKPKFCGKLDGKAEDNGNFTDNKGFWKLLIDRRMYDTRGVYQDLTVVDMQDFNPDLVDPEQTAKEFKVTRVADEAGTQEIVDRVIERENNRLGGSARVNYGLTLDKAVELYQTAKTKPSEYYSALAQTEGYVSEEEANEDRISYRTVTDQKLIDELNSGELIEVYRAMQVIDGKLYPPMSAYVDGVLREPSERGTWEESEEHPEQADENGNFLLEKGKSDDGKRKSLKAAYNPYYHTALNPINDQFSEAQNRSNMVIVKGLVPKSEIDNPYHAEKAKDSTGRVKWHKGPLAGILGQYEGKGREVILSRYFKPIDIVPESEIADVAASLFKDTTLEKNPLPSNVFTPALRAELEKKGFTFVETDNTGELIDKPGVTWASVYGKKGLGNAGLVERVAKGKKLTKDQIKALEFIGVKPEDVKVDNNGSLMFRTENANQSAFISNALASLDKIQMKSGNAQAWINKIQQAGGLKKEEDKWIGLTDWLKEQTGNISKDDVAEYIREHQIQIEEVKYGMSLPEDAFEFDYVEDIDNAYVSINDWEKAVALYNESNKDQIDVNDPSDENWNKVEAFGNSLLGNKINPIRNKYTTGGLENKREIALTVPTIEPYKANDEVHFGDAGDGRAIAWARFGDDVDADGNRVLVIDEIQSKRHQEGKDKGYKGDKEYQEAKDRYDRAMADVDAYWKELTDKYGLEVNTNMTPDEKSLLDDKTSVGREAFLNLEEKSQKQKESVPDAPFRDSWDALAMKRMLRLAAEEGYDKIAWTSGQMQSDRYSMTKVLGDFYYKPNGDGTYKVSAALNQRRAGYTYYSDLNYDSLTVDKIGEIFGKDIATKVSEGKGRKGYSHNNEIDWITFSGRDLKMANEGMRYFYDQKLVNWMNKYGKKWGVQVTDLTLPNLENEEGWHSVDVTPEMRESVMQGQVMFRTAEQREQLFADAKNEFGTTTDMREAGYLLPDGSMLDFSEKNNGGEPGTRGADHRDIARVINDRSYDTMTEYLDDFINEGAIRLIPESGAFSVAQQPTKEQKNILRNFIYRYNGEVDVEIYKDGHSVANPYYRERTSPQRVLNDIDAYFNDGTIPEGNAPMFRTDISPEVREEMDAIVAEAKANGTYLKAPNGADTKLTPEQWAMVRTKNFKNWFGDWESAAKLVDEDIQFKDLIGKTIIGYRYGKAPEGGRSFNTLTRSYEAGVSMASVGYNAEVGSFAAMANEQEGKYYYIGEIAEETGGDDEICLNNVRELTKEEYESLLPQYTAISNAVANAYYNRSANVASKGYDIDLESAKAKRDAAIREIDSSKVVDENGEPMVVYHGTKWNPNEEEAGNAVFKAGWFTSIKSRAEGFGEPVSAFINIRKPAYSEEANATEGFDLNNPKTFGEYDGYLNVENYPSNPKLSEGAKRVIKMRNPNNYEEALAIAEASMTRGKQFFSIIPAYPNQIKSATDNNGEFNPDNPDIRFRTYYGGNSGYVGYSMSKRAFNAREDGAYPKTDFKKNYNISQPLLDILVNAGVVSDDEWHHTSMYGNKTTFYRWNDFAYKAFSENRDAVESVYKDNTLGNEEKTALIKDIIDKAITPIKEQFDALSSEYDAVRQTINTLNKESKAELDAYKAEVRSNTEDFVASNGVTVRTDENGPVAYDSDGNRLSKRNGKGMRDSALKEFEERYDYYGKRFEFSKEQELSDAVSRSQDLNARMDALINAEKESNGDVMFRTEYTPVVEIGRNGLSAFLEKKNSSLTDFVNAAWLNYNSNKVDGSVAKQIADMMANGDTLNEAYLSVMADIAAKPTLTEDEKAFATQSAEVLSAIAEEEISGNETLWAVYKEARKDKTGMFDRFADIKVGRNLGTEPGIDPKDSIVDYLTEAGKAEADVKTKHKALMALADALSDIRTAMRAQREYDRMTAQDMVTLSRLAIASGLLDDATRSEVKRLLGIVKRTIGMAKIRGRVDELYNLILDNCLRNVESYYKTAMKRKPVKVNKNGVVAQGALDIDGQRLMETYKDALDMPVDDDGSGRKTIADRMNEAFDRYNGEDETKAHEAEVDINALSLAKRYLTDVVASLAEEKDMKQSLESAKDALKKGQLTEEDYKQLIKETKACITTTKADRLKALSDITQNLLDFQKASRGAAAEFSARQKEHIAEIYRDAERDMEGRPFDENPQTPGLIQKIVGSQAAQLFLAPLATFDMVFRMVGNKNAAGEGYLYNRFVRGWIDCSGAEQTNTESAFSELDEKVSEVFGKKMRWSDLYSVVRGMPQVECFFIDGGEKKSHMLTQGNLMYILLADNMEDGRMKLRNMGISEEDVEAIRKQMDPRFLELGRWVVEEFLPSRREAYNEVHMRMFGAPMSSVDNYFPLHILKGARTENVDVASANTEPVSPSTITGNIIKRTKNALALDVMGTDAFSAVIEHVQKMEHWRAFAEWNRDISTLLSNRKFRNRIVNMSSMYGYGEDLWKTFKDVCMVAAGSYSPKGVTKVDKSIMKIAKGVTAAKISLRVFTALKQFLSFPAYFSEANAEYLVKGIANPMKGWNWCIENLPLFRKRWLSRQAGDHILSTSEDWHSRLVENAARVGMSPNAFVDALTVSIGAYAIYQTKYRKYKDMGYSDEAADRRAKQDATISYNETQQSNENAFLSPMQMDRSYATAMLTVFRNSSMGYTRQVADAARNLKRRMDKGYREKSIAFMTEQLINDGLDPAKAPGAARRMYARQGVKDVTRVAIFGYVMQFAWNLGAYGLYLLFGDDDDKKKEMLTDVAVHSLFGSIEGLSAGNVISELGNMIAMGESLNNYDPTLMPLMSDAKNVISEFSRDNVAAINSIVNLVVQMGLGVNPQTVEDMVLAIIDAAKGDPVVAQEALILGLRLIEAPQSQIEQIYLDEIQLSAVDAQKMTIPELAERYARYKTSRGATLTGWLYTDADKDEVMNKHIQNFENKAKERLTADMANQRYVQLEEDAKALENRVTLLRQKAIQGDEQASAELNDIFLSEDYGRALRFQEQQKLINAKAKEAVEAPTVDEMLTALADIDRMKKQLYDDFAGEESPSYLKDQYVQYTKGILAQMAKLDKKYETEYIQRNPEYEKMMAQYQKDLDNAANEAKSNRERITELEEEKLKYRKPGKKTYFPRYKNRVKEINDSIKELRSRGTSAASIMSKVKKSLDVGEEAYMPSDILNSDEFRAYLAVKDLGSISGNTFVFKEVADLEQKIKEAEKPETKAKLAKRRDDLMGRMAQLVSRELNNVDDSDEVIE